jgi:multiple sugar transport system substrate-binding protein
MRGLSSILFVRLLVFLLAACGLGPSGEPPNTISIVFKHGKVSGDPRPLQRLLDRFEEANPTIRVRDEPLPPSTDQQHQVYAINLEGGGEGLDVLAMDVIWVPEFSRAGWIRSLDEEFPPDTQARFLPNTIQAVSYQGHIFAVPWNIDAGVLFYRSDMLRKYGRAPPSSWPDLVETTRVILTGEKDPRLYGFIWQGREYEGLICNALEFIWGNGGEVLDAGSHRTTVAQPETGGALVFMRDLIHRYRVSPGLILSADEETSRHLFGTGRAIFTRNWPYAWSLFERDGSSVQGKTGLAALPAFPGHEPASTLGGWHLGISRRSRHPEAAWRLIQFLTTSASQKTMTLATGMLPTRAEVYEDPQVLASQPFLRELRPILTAARPRPVTPFYPMVSQILQSEFSAIIAGRRSPEKALESAQRQLDRILELDPHE